MPGLDEARTRPGTGPAVFHASARKEDPPPGNSGLVEKRGTTTRRNPMFLLRLFGLFLLRYAQRTFLALLLNDPPRTTRWCVGRPPHKGQPSRSPLRAQGVGRLFDPSAQQPPDLGHHPGGVAVLAGGEPIPTGGKAEVDSHLRQVLIGQTELG